MIKRKARRVNGSALISSILLINICIAFVIGYQQIFAENMESNIALINYFSK